MSASKALIRTGFSLMTRFANPSLHQNPTSPQLISTRTLDIAPKLFRSLYSPSQNDADSIKKLSSQGFLYPCGLPSLPFFLPDGDDSTSSEPMVISQKNLPAKHH